MSRFLSFFVFVRLPLFFYDNTFFLFARFLPPVCESTFGSTPYLNHNTTNCAIRHFKYLLLKVFFESLNINIQSENRTEAPGSLGNILFQIN